MRVLPVLIGFSCLATGCRAPAFARATSFFQTSTAKEIFSEVKKDIKAAEDGIEQACQGVEASKTASKTAIDKAQAGVAKALEDAQTKKDVAANEAQSRLDGLKQEALDLSKDLKTAMGDQPKGLVETFLGTEKKSP